MTAPPLVIERNGVVVRADDLEEAERMAGVFVDLDRKVRCLLEVNSPPTPELWLLDHGFDGPIDATFSLDPPIVGLGQRHHESQDLMAHELAHHYMRRWPSRLPAVIEEGLADMVGGVASDKLQAIRKWHASVLDRTKVMSITNVLRLSSGDFVKIRDRKVTSALRSVGFRLVDKMGVEELRRMCLRASELDLAHVPIEWFTPIWADVSKPKLGESESFTGRGTVTPF